MDFTWVTTDDANAIQNSIVDAKGDLISATANDTPARLAVGNNGETLVADSSTSTGLRYQSAYNGNGIINGGMDIWQRGTSFALTSPAVGYTADRWLARHLGTNVSYSQQTSGLTGFQYSLRIQRPVSVTGTNAMTIYYNMETADSYRFAGQTVTLSYYAKAGANFSGASNNSSVGLYSGTGTNQNITSGSLTGQATVVEANRTLTTSWQRFSVTGTVGSTATQLAFVIFYDPTGTAGANDWMEVTGVQLEVGSVATSFKRSGSGGGTIQGELSACQRYYFRETGSSIYLASGGIAGSTTAAYVIMRHPVTMRVAPTSVDYSSLRLQIISNTFNLTNCTISDASPHGTVINATVASGLTATTQSYMLMTQASATAHLGLSAEL
jgi:hypothetical protein